MDSCRICVWNNYLFCWATLTMYGCKKHHSLLTEYFLSLPPLHQKLTQPWNLPIPEWKPVYLFSIAECLQGEDKHCPISPEKRCYWTYQSRLFSLSFSPNQFAHMKHRSLNSTLSRKVMFSVCGLVCLLFSHSQKGRSSFFLVVECLLKSDDANFSIIVQIIIFMCNFHDFWSIDLINCLHYVGQSYAAFKT